MQRVPGAKAQGSVGSRFHAPGRGVLWVLSRGCLVLGPRANRGDGVSPIEGRANHGASGPLAVVVPNGFAQVAFSLTLRRAPTFARSRARAQFVAARAGPLLFGWAAEGHGAFAIVGRVHESLFLPGSNRVIAQVHNR